MGQRAFIEIVDDKRGLHAGDLRVVIGKEFGGFAQLLRMGPVFRIINHNEFARCKGQPDIEGARFGARQARR